MFSFNALSRTKILSQVFYYILKRDAFLFQYLPTHELLWSLPFYHRIKLICFKYIYIYLPIICGTFFTKKKCFTSALSKRSQFTSSTRLFHDFLPFFWMIHFQRCEEEGIFFAVLNIYSHFLSVTKFSNVFNFISNI